MNNEILNAANKYARGLKNVEARRSQWLEKYKQVRDQLKEIAAELNEKSDYKPGYFVDSSHAYNHEINGTCANIPAITFRSGSMPMNVSFKNPVSGHLDYTENGFHITFMPAITGQVLVLLELHSSNIDNQKPEEVNLAVFDNPASITNIDVDALMLKAIKMAFYTSFTGMIDLQEEEITKTQPKYSPIGFKRYESTEKVK